MDYELLERIQEKENSEETTTHISTYPIERRQIFISNREMKMIYDFDLRLPSLDKTVDPDKVVEDNIHSILTVKSKVLKTPQLIILISST